MNEIVIGCSSTKNFATLKGIATKEVWFVLVGK